MALRLTPLAPPAPVAPARSPAARFSTGRLLYPREGALIALPDTLRWRPGDDPMQHGFTLQIAAGGDFDHPLVEHRTTATTFALAAGRSYAWRLGTVGVVMRWTPARSFTVAETGPAAPRLTAPDDGAVDVAQPILLRCRTARGAPPADGFGFEAASDAAFAHVVLAADADGAEGQASIQGLAPGRRYYWRARAFEHRTEGKRAGPWSAARVFTTLARPEAPHLKSKSSRVPTSRRPCCPSSRSPSRS